MYVIDQDYMKRAIELAKKEKDGRILIRWLERSS